MKVIKHFATVATVALLAGRAIAMDFNLGYSCRTNGNWTQSALDETSRLIKTIESIKDDPNCKGKGLETFAAQLQVAEAQFNKSLENGEDQKRESTAAQKGYLNSLLNSGDPKMDKKALTELAAGVHIGSAIDNTVQVAPYLSNIIDLVGMKSNLKNAANDVVNLINSTMANYPSFSQCLVAAPNQGLAMMSAMLKVSTNILTSGYADGSDKMGNILANLVSFLREAKLAGVIKDLNQTELWASITCALESATQNYCSAKDNVKLLNWSINQLQKGVEGDAKKSDTVKIRDNSLIAGYYALIRNVPSITNWLLKVQFGVEPKLSTEGTYKNLVWETVLSMTKAINNLIATYNEMKANIEGMEQPMTQKIATYKLIKTLQSIMNDALSGGGGGSYGATKMNFFLNSMPGELLPLYLIGYDIDNMPPETKPNADGKIPMNIDFWLENGGQYRPMFNDIPKLLSTIKTRLDRLIDQSLSQTSKFFVRKLIADKPNLVAGAFVYNSLNTSVYESFHFVSGYLKNLLKKIEKSPYRDEQILPVIDDTIKKVDNVIELFDSALNRKVVAEDNNSVQSQSEKIINAVYENFNVLIQRDSFFTNRMSTFVYYDYFLNILEEENYNDYEKQLMIISNNEMLQRIMQVSETEPALNREDFDNALAITIKNLNGLENIFRDNYFDYLQSTEDDAKGLSYTQRNLRTVKRALHTDIPSEFRGSPFVPIIAATNVLFTYDYRYELYWNNPFKPKYQRGDNDHNSLERNKNRVCVQLLATQRPEIFSEFCKDAVITSPFYEAAEHKEKYEYLNTKFSDYVTKADERKWWMKATGAWAPKKEEIKNDQKSYDDKICAYRDYLRKNQVYWLTLQHEQIKNRKEMQLKQGRDQ
ncbi:MAG: hypothetical protein A2504_15675 [Bdellovibrionales bacterium RIFOXYD12_FULL_39_22]|nr:MAG: hypothetical protein A2385_03105 [Bdellovibrionales bacterium RIFOXYB1_FULL_39_21]OFZ43233.1 MAG: hypothetical protein A2485_12250 [Bdellovibrionales bacterium RIFOXYC12_FULL_39_17]OFZ47971.1 MAG: hypothetical protein A2404_16890 [Bdellovibrionales bacterium RIFOXYC1_FULL_39_130]OFZ75751.1 MAG: hypothetical protein A2560_13390 [Bdellovibrionales bacterium RIFOXYD1_FULL_39_84]OFZ94241.1 MAG: hypothetical protein A2504_15675 [Bdellovibrionales bacterium RIFOXYD12_FULL_39_22]HLE11689.1 hy